MVGNNSHWVYKLIEHYLNEHTWATGGYGHIVLADYNLDDSSIDYCLESLGAIDENTPLDKLPQYYISDMLGRGYDETGIDWQLIADDVRFLEQLRLIPESIRNEAVMEYLAE